MAVRQQGVGQLGEEHRLLGDLMAELGGVGREVLTEAEDLARPAQRGLPVDRVVAAAIENRMEMLELELQLAKDASTVDYLRNQALPLVTVNYTYNINGLGPTRSDAADAWI